MRYLDETDVVECMKSAGFEYSPAPIPTTETAVVQPSRELAQQNGFGIMVTSDLTDDPTEESDQDPNGLYLDSLTASEQAAWKLALYGNETDGSASPESCFGAHEEREQQVRKDAGLSADDLTLIAEEYQALIDSDPAVVEARNSWRSCMAESAYLYGSREEIKSALEQELEDTLQSGQSVSPSQISAEQALAVADFECSADERGAVAAAKDRARAAILSKFGYS